MLCGLSLFGCAGSFFSHTNIVSPVYEFVCLSLHMPYSLSRSLTRARSPSLSFSLLLSLSLSLSTKKNTFVSTLLLPAFVCIRMRMHTYANMPSVYIRAMTELTFQKESYIFAYNTCVHICMYVCIYI